MDFSIGLEQVSNSSTQLVTWALAIIAGTIATIVSTSYMRPMSKVMRIFYLLYIPGWFFLGYSIYYGDKISRRYIASKLVPEQNVVDIAKCINQDFGCQQLTLKVGLSIFAVWLVAFLIWWVFCNWSVSGDHKEGS
jgi:hypothetical protein